MEPDFSASRGEFSSYLMIVKHKRPSRANTFMDLRGG